MVLSSKVDDVRYFLTALPDYLHSAQATHETYSSRGCVLNNHHKNNNKMQWHSFVLKNDEKVHERQ